MPSFTNENDAREFLINFFEDFLKKIEEEKCFEKKVEIFREFNMSDFNAEGQLLNGKPIRDCQDYQITKSLIINFFNWLEQNKNINVFNASNADNFYNQMYGEKTLMVAKLIQLISSLPQDLQIYFILNIYRTTYELNFKNMCLLIDQSRTNRGVNVSEYSIQNLEDEFRDYPKIEEIMKYFKNDLRNPIAHEDWFIKNNWVLTRNKKDENKKDLQEISMQIYDLFYFRVALTTYLLEQFPNFMKNIKITNEQISKFVENIKLKLNELKK